MIDLIAMRHYSKVHEVNPCQGSAKVLRGAVYCSSTYCPSITAKSPNRAATPVRYPTKSLAMGPLDPASWSMSMTWPILPPGPGDGPAPRRAPRRPLLMGNHFQTIVDLHATPADATALAARGLDWLVAEGIVRAERTDCVLGAPLGHPPGPLWAKAVEQVDWEPSDGLKVERPNRLPRRAGRCHVRRLPSLRRPRGPVYR